MNEMVAHAGRTIGHYLPPLRSAWTAILVVILAVLLSDPHRLGEHLLFAARALAGTAPYILAAVLMIGYLKASGAEKTIATAFEGREGRMIVAAALIGGLAPFCSCEVIPFVAGLLAAGAPLSAIMAFWLSSPLIDPPSLFITAAALGWNFAIAKAVFAVLTGIFGGLSVAVLARAGFLANPAKAGISGGGCGAGLTSGRPVWKFWEEPDRRQVFATESRKNAIFLFKWLTLAYLLEAMLVAYVPAEMIGAVVGGEGILPVILSASLGAPAYLNSYVAPAVVAGLMEQGMSVGAAMAFMIAGAISSIPAMVAVFSLVRVPVFLAYIGLGLVSAIGSGLIYMSLLQALFL